MRVSLAVVGLALALVAAGCGGNSDEEQAEALIESLLGNDTGVEFDVDDEGFSVEFDDGSITSGGSDDEGQIEVADDGGSFSFGGGDVPDDFPIAIADGGMVVSTFDLADAVSVTLTYPDGQFDQLVEHYQGELESLGDVSEVTSTGGDFRSAAFFVDGTDDLDGTGTSANIVEDGTTGDVTVILTAIKE